MGDWVGRFRTFDRVANPITTRCLGWQRSPDHIVNLTALPTL